MDSGDFWLTANLPLHFFLGYLEGFFGVLLYLDSIDSTHLDFHSDRKSQFPNLSQTPPATQTKEKPSDISSSTINSIASFIHQDIFISFPIYSIPILISFK